MIFFLACCVLFLGLANGRLRTEWDSRPRPPLVIGPYWRALIEQDRLQNPSDYEDNRSIEHDHRSDHQDRAILPLPVGFTCVGGPTSCGLNTAASASVPLPPSTLPYVFVSTTGGTDGVGQCCSAGGVNGATLTSPIFQRSAGEILSFAFNYITSDGGQFNDYAHCSLFSSGNLFIGRLITARTAASGDTIPGAGLGAISAVTVPSNNPIIPGAPTWPPLDSSSGSCFDVGCGTTGWILASYTFTTSGTFYLQCGVTNTIDGGFQSGLALDFTVSNGIFGDTTEIGTE